jgi:hypothetical protein
MLAAAPIVVADEYATAWSSAASSRLRMAAAEWWSFRFEASGEREADVLRSVGDDAKEVRAVALSRLSYPRPTAVDEVIAVHPDSNCSAAFLFAIWNVNGGGDINLTRNPRP